MSMTNTNDGVLPGVEPPRYQQEQQAAQADAAAQQAAAEQQARFTEDQMNKARSDERDKMFNRLNETSQAMEQMKSELAELKAAREAEQKAIEEAEQARLAAEAAAEEEKMSAKALVNKVREEMQTEFQSLRQREEQAQAMLEQERRFNALQEYKNQRLTDPEVLNAVHPSFRDWIGGNSEDEIEASIARAVQSTQQIVGEVQQELATFRQQQPGVSPYAPHFSPADQQNGQRVLTAEDIRGMSPQEYAKNRQQLLQARPGR